MRIALGCLIVVVVLVLGTLGFLMIDVFTMKEVSSPIVGTVVSKHYSPGYFVNNTHIPDSWSLSVDTGDGVVSSGISNTEYNLIVVGDKVNIINRKGYFGIVKGFKVSR